MAIRGLNRMQEEMKELNEGGNKKGEAKHVNININLKLISCVI